MKLNHLLPISSLSPPPSNIQDESSRPTLRTFSKERTSNIDRWTRAYINSKDQAISRTCERKGKEVRGKSVEVEEKENEEGSKREGKCERERESRMRDVGVQIQLEKEGERKVVATQTEEIMFVPSIPFDLESTATTTTMERSSRGSMSMEEVRAYEGIESLDEDPPSSSPLLSTLSTPRKASRELDFELLYREKEEELVREKEKNAMLEIKLDKVVSILTNLDLGV